MEQKKPDKLKIIIIVLAVLLAISVCALAGTVIYRRFFVENNATVIVPDNLISSEENKETDTEEIGGENIVEDVVSNDGEGALENGGQTDTGDGTASESGNTSKPERSEENKKPQASGTAAEQKDAIAISLYNKQPGDNSPFSVGNMFPGDSVTKYYRVQVSYHDRVSVHFKADIREGYEKLAEVLMIRVRMPESDKIVYEGLMRDMPSDIIHKLSSPDSTTAEIYYEITVYLSTSVGNEYQNKALFADFNWWVEETGNLDKAPQTGDDTNITLWLVMAIIAASVCVILLVIQRKEEDEQNG